MPIMHDRALWIGSDHGADRRGIVYPVCEVATRYSASVNRETTKPAEAYAKAHAGLPRSKWVKYRPGLLPDND